MKSALLTVSHLFKTSERMIAEILSHVDAKALSFRPSDEMSSILRLYAHLSVQRHKLVHAIKGGHHDEKIPFADSASVFAKPTDKLPAKAEVDTAWAAITHRLHEAFQHLSVEQLDGPGRGKGVFPTDDETLLGTIAFIAHQEAYHIGQMSYLARMQGKLPEIGHLG
ncbi:MAG TPA: DinB family protein [Kofleriaceae bacterium]|jgi:hypothetical protein|nr:DinB family protein [Kofleriaceae bacterium]